MTKPFSLTEFFNFLKVIEDYFQDGFHRNHPKILMNLEAPKMILEKITHQISQCKKCELYKDRTHTVPGQGVIEPQVLIVGEGPGADEDRTGKPFVGNAGRYLDKWLKAIELDRNKNCFISNIVKCRPPNNRDPRPEESSACLPYLEKQIECIKPRAILTLGRISTQILTGDSAGIGVLRGKLYSYRDIPLIPTYHPSAVLRNPSLRSAVWEDLKLLRSKLGNG